MNAEVRQIRTSAEQALTDAFAAAKRSLPGDGAVAALREAAFRKFEAQGLPHRRVEEWKYTDLRAFMREAKPLASAPGAKAGADAARAGRLAAGANARRIVFVDGAFQAALSDLAALEKGLTVRSLADVLAKPDSDLIGRLGQVVLVGGDPAFALNSAFMGDGAVIEIADGARIARPLHLVFLTASEKATAVYSRSLLVAGRGAHVTLIESHEGPDGLDYQVNHALELVAGDEAEVSCLKLATEGDKALHISTLAAALGARTKFNALAFTAGSAVTRNQVFLRFNGEGSEADIRGATLVRGRQHVDNTLVIDHAVAHCTSRELFKAVLDGESRSVFQGKIVVQPGAQKTDGKMMTRALLLSEDAEADNKPELEIFADDVVCGHGATVGALDKDLLFYLRARGIPQKEAESLLIQSFVGEAVEGVRIDAVRETLMDAVRVWLAARG